MANRLQYVAGTLGSGLTWASAGFTASDFNSLASGSCVVAASAINNSTPLDVLIDVSFSLEVGGTTTALSVLYCYLLPLNRDGSTYGDGVATGSTLPSIGYQRGQIGVKSGVTSGNAVTGTFEAIRVPPGSFKLAIGSGLTVALDSTAAAAVEYRSYTFTLNG